MNEEKTLLHAEEADKLLASADGTAALLYLHILRSGGFSLTGAAKVLRRNEAEIGRAADTLRRLGLLRAPEPPLPDQTLPEISAEDIVRRADTDSAFHGLVCEAEKTLGRVLSAHDLQVLFGIYDHLGLPADVIMLLLHHCIEECQARSGAGRMPTMRAIEKEGWYWAQQEIVSLDAAEEHLRARKQQREAAEQAKAALQIHGRELTATERKYVENWLELGFGPDALAIAYDRTVLRTGKLTWKYMDSIMKSWSAKQLLTPEEIEAKDPAQRDKARAAAAKAGNSEKMEQMRKMVGRLNGSGGGKGA